MPVTTLTLSSKNYSSWSLRGWLMARLAGLDFAEEMVEQDDANARAELLLLAPSVRVPRLTHGDIPVGETLAIVANLNEIQPQTGLLRADAHPDQPAAADLERGRSLRDARIFDRDLFEKVALISLLVIIFSEMLPTSNATLGQIVFNVTLFVSVITAISHVLARRATRVVSGVVHFAIMAVVGFGLIALTGWLFREATNWFNATIFVLLLSVIVTLFDRFQIIQRARGV